MSDPVLVLINPPDVRTMSFELPDRWIAADGSVTELSASQSATGIEPLNLGDLVEGATIDTIFDYLSLNFDGTDTIIDGKPTVEGGAPQRIVMAGVDLVGMGESDQEILSQMINDRVLKIDT